MNFIKNPAYFWESILITGVILYLSFAPPVTFKGIPTFNNEDKIVHMLMYFSLCFMLIFDFQKIADKLKSSQLTFMLLCIGFPIFLGGVVEILQPMYFSRDASWFDWIADILGIAIGFLIMVILKKTPLTPFRKQK